MAAYAQLQNPVPTSEGLKQAKEPSLQERMHVLEKHILVVHQTLDRILPPGPGAPSSDGDGILDTAVRCAVRLSELQERVTDLADTLGQL